MVHSTIILYANLNRRRQHELRHKRQLKWKIAALLRVRMTLRVRNYLTSSALISPSNSPWAQIYRSRDDGAFINTVAIPVAAFERLLLSFTAHYVVKSGPGKRGRPPRFCSINNVLACLLHFYAHAVEHKTLCEMFGAPPSTLSRVLSNAEVALHKALPEVPEAQIRWPTFDQQRSWAASVTKKEALVRGCFCVADGKNYAVQEPSASDLQNAYFNGRSF
eukprot:jgi/Phyca11/119534/e_gw1.39.386.1